MDIKIRNVIQIVYCPNVAARVTQGNRLNFFAPFESRGSSENFQRCLAFQVFFMGYKC